MWKQLRSVYTNNEIVSGNTKQHQLEIILSLSCDIMQHHFDVMCKYPLSQIPGWRPSWLQAVAPDPSESTSPPTASGPIWDPIQ
jgi:hypothetical protein